MIVQEAAEHATEAAPTGVDTAAHAAEAAGHATDGPFDLGSMLMGKVSDATYVDLFGYHLELPQWAPVHIGSFAIDLSPSKNAVFMAFAGAVCLLVLLAAARTIRRMDGTKAPSGIANAVEGLVLFFRDQVVRTTIGHHSDGYTPFILTLFVFILVMNVLGLIPYGISSTASISVTAALAVICFFVVEISGFRALGPAGYAKTIFYAPKGMHPAGQAAMLVIMTPIEAMGKLAKPFALAVRLFANMLAGKILILALVGMIFLFGDLAFARWGIAGGAVAMASAITILKVFIALLQAFIFTMLTAVFIGLVRHAH
jgi:F-type H+-transporting ATPase subunit a